MGQRERWMLGTTAGPGKDNASSFFETGLSSQQLDRINVTFRLALGQMTPTTHFSSVQGNRESRAVDLAHRQAETNSAETCLNVSPCLHLYIYYHSNYSKYFKTSVDKRTKNYFMKKIFLKIPGKDILI